MTASPPRTASIVECGDCHADVQLLDHHPFMASHLSGGNGSRRCAAGATGRWLDNSLRHVPHPDHDERCEAEFVYGPMVWTACRCGERRAAR